MRNLIIASLIIGSGLVAGCGAHGDDPGRAYMPDMYYSRAYEAYGYNDIGGERDTLSSRGITYTALPVPGSIARGDMNTNLSADSSGLAAAANLRNPYDTIQFSRAEMAEAERLYLVNCGICHGAKLDGNGPLYNGGQGPYPVAPRNLVDDYTKALSDGHMFHVITYGIRSMGSYASQLKPQQRWAVVKYIRTKQNGGKAGANGNGAAADTTASSTPTTNAQ